MSRPIALMLDPISWRREWSYEVERQILGAAGVDLVVPADPAEQERVAAIADVVVASGMHPVDATRLATFARCVGVICYSAGRDRVDEAAAAELGIPVTGVHNNADEVADHAMALLLAATRLIVPMARRTEAGNWGLLDAPEIWQIPRLRGSTLGIVGTGHVGLGVAERARAFGMRTIAAAHRPPAEPDPLLPIVPLDELVATADAIVLAASLTPGTRHLVDADLLARAKRGAVLVNIARGDLIDEVALAAALDDGRIGAAALDVRSNEPPGPDDPLTGRPGVLQTPHIGGASASALADLHRLAAEGVLDLLRRAGRLPEPPSPR